MEIWAEKLAAVPPLGSGIRVKNAFRTVLYEKSQGPNLFALESAPMSNSKNVISHGTVCKNYDGRIVSVARGNNFPSKVAEITGRVAKK